MEDKDIGYLEAMLDLHGSFSLILDDNSKRSPDRKNFSYKPLVRISSKILPVMQKLGLILDKKPIKRKTDYGTKYFEFLLTSGAIKHYIPHVKLTIKEPQRLLIIEAVELTNKLIGDKYNKEYHDRLMDIRNSLRDLNKSWGVLGSKHLKDKDKAKQINYLEQKLVEIKEK